MEVNERVAKAGGPAIASFLATATEAWRSALGRNLAGVYVYGSLSSGAFNPRSSDIDVLVTTREPTDDAAHERLAELYRAMLGWTDEQLAGRLEAMFVPVKALAGPGIPDIAVLELHPDEGFKIQPLGPDFVIQKHLLRTHGITLAGRDLAKLVAPVTTGELREAALGNLRRWWLPQLEFPGQFLTRMYQAYAVLTMCRTLCLLATGDVVTKPQAAAWALRAAYLEPWHPLIVSALAYPGGRQPDQRIASIEFVRFTLEDAGIGRSAPSS
jgi:predicted nucleotidyltransferase